jgi:hypothetical protein
MNSSRSWGGVSMPASRSSMCTSSGEIPGPSWTADANDGDAGHSSETYIPTGCGP